MPREGKRLYVATFCHLNGTMSQFFLCEISLHRRNVSQSKQSFVPPCLQNPRLNISLKELTVSVNTVGLAGTTL